MSDQLYYVFTPQPCGINPEPYIYSGITNVDDLKKSLTQTINNLDEPDLISLASQLSHQRYTPFPQEPTFITLCRPKTIQEAIDYQKNFDKSQVKT